MYIFNPPIELLFVFALYGRVTFLCLSKEKSPKEKIPNMPALRVPCDARMSQRDVKLANRSDSHIPNPPAHPVLLGEPEREV